MTDGLNSLGGASAQPTLRLVTPSAPAQPDPGASQSQGSASTAASPTSSAPVAQAQPATRIMVDRADSGVYVYRLVDVATGRTLAELPRSQSDQLKLTDAYAPGALATTSA